MSPTTPPPAPPRPPRTLTGLEPFAPRTDIRVGQKIGPLVAYGNYDDGTTGTVNAEWTSTRAWSRSTMRASRKASGRARRC